MTSTAETTLMIFRLGCATLLALLGAGLPLAAQARAGSAGRTPTLVVFITVDALRPDYFQRFERQLTGGLGRLYRGGAYFSNGYQDHAATETAPGHSATMSGRYPVNNGITSNIHGVGDTAARLIEAGGLAASPFRFIGTTLTDWLIAKDSRTRALSVSRKDRGAILPIGKSKQAVFWYSSNGTFTTSDYYGAALPSWVRAFNARRIPQSHAGRAWTTLLPASAYAEPDSVPIESEGQSYTFPHYMPQTADLAARALPGFPWMDEATLQLALAGVRAMRLGAGPHTDVLAISLSATDAIGHQYGPDSREVHDQVLRLDRFIGVFMDSLFRMRRERDVVFALTADHGLTPFPEVRGYDANTGARRVDVRPAFEQLSASLSAAGVPGHPFRVASGVMRGAGFSFEPGVVSLDRSAVTAVGLKPDSVIEALRTSLMRIPGVARADRISELAARDTVNDAVARRWLHVFADETVASLVVSLAPFNMWGPGSYAQHGSPNDHDARVPILFYGRPFRAGRNTEFAAVVDMAPTLAAVLRVTPSERLDGRVLRNAIR